MAERKGQRSKQTKAGTRSRPAEVARGGGESLEQLRFECERLKAQLEAAREELVDLRARQDDALNRIDWVLDSLNSLQDP